jgi:hypothetical protein
MWEDTASSAYMCCDLILDNLAELLSFVSRVRSKTTAQATSAAGKCVRDLPAQAGTE